MFRRVVAAIVAFSLALSLSTSAHAFVDTTGAYFGNLANERAAGRLGARIIQGIAAGAAAGTISSGLISPLGGLAIGLIVAGAAMLTGDTTVAVDTADIEDSPNPDVTSGGVLPNTTKPYMGFGIKTGRYWTWLYYPQSGTYDSSTAAAGSDYAKYAAKVIPFLSARYGVGVTKVYTSTGTDCVGGSPCTRVVFNNPAPLAGAALTQLNSEAGWVYNVAGGTHATFKGVLLSNGGIDCEGGTHYDTSLDLCVFNNPPSGQSLDDGLCRVSPTSASGEFVYNPFDPDCQRAKDKGALKVTPGTATTPPSVTATDPATGESITVAKPRDVAQGTPQAPSITHRQPDPTNNTTTETRTVTEPPAVEPKPDNPLRQPKSSGSTRTTYPGTGTGTGSTAVDQVSVTNWPAIYTITGTVTCSNCQPSSTGGGTSTGDVTVNVDFPEMMKIDPEGKSENDLPDLDTVAGTRYTDSDKDVLKPIKDKLNPFATFTLPAHSSSCPSFTLDWHAWNLNLSVSSASLCAYLENSSIKSVIQGGLMAAYTVGAIALLLTA